MTDFPDSHRDLLDAPVAAFSTVGADGIPQSTLVWFLHEDGELKLSLNNSRVKYRNLLKRPHCSLLLLDPNSQYRYLEVRGQVRIDPDDDYVFAGRVGAKYGADVREYDAPGTSRVMVTIEPTRVYPVDMTG